jgi:hypothetical protein
VKALAVDPLQGGSQHSTWFCAGRIKSKLFCRYAPVQSPLLRAALPDSLCFLTALLRSSSLQTALSPYRDGSYYHIPDEPAHSVMAQSLRWCPAFVELPDREGEYQGPPSSRLCCTVQDGVDSLLPWGGQTTLCCLVLDARNEHPASGDVSKPTEDTSAVPLRCQIWILWSLVECPILKRSQEVNDSYDCYGTPLHAVVYKLT